jgi:SAM-dependent methyltransferase
MDNLDEPVPPEESIFIGGGNFREIGQEFFRYLVELGGLRPFHRVLDIGCGIGRIAIPLTHYLDGSGGYDGFDIVPLGIAWCRERITSRFPHFRFRTADLFNGSYNPSGRFEARAYAFPYPDETFDFVLATSVFTHLLPADLENYLYEISRVLKPGGNCLLTYFLLNRESAELLDAGRSELAFRYDKGVYRTITAHRPEDAVCYDETFVRGLHAKYGLTIRQPIRYGSWCGRPKGLSHQDIVVASRHAGVWAPKPWVSAVRRLGLALRRFVHGRVLGTVRRLGNRAAASELDRHVRARHAGSRLEQRRG